MAYALYGLGASGLVPGSDPSNPNTIVWKQIDTAARASIASTPAQWISPPCTPARIVVSVNGPSGTLATVGTAAEVIEKSVLRGLVVVAVPVASFSSPRQFIITTPCDAFVQAVVKTIASPSMQGPVNPLGWWFLKPRNWSMPT